MLSPGVGHPPAHAPCPTASLLAPQKTLYGANVIIFEGIMAFADKELLKVRKGSKEVLGMPDRRKCCGPLLCRVLSQHKASHGCPGAPVCRRMGPRPQGHQRHPYSQPSTPQPAGGTWWEHAFFSGSTAGR